MKKVLCHGVYDVLHSGHLQYFKSAKQFGDYLIVSITTDRFVNKGPGRPYFSTAKRAEMIRALKVVDEVIISDSPTATEIISLIKPDVYVKGPDYKDLSKDVTGEIHNEKKAVEAHGGQLCFTEDETFSSSTIINRFFQPWTDQQRATIDQVQSLGGLREIERCIDEIGKLRVLVVGEPIIDIYRFVTPEGISSKSPSISARFNYQEEYFGGSLAIRNHLEDFTQEIMLQHHGTAAKKIRYISGQQRIFEVTEIEDNWWNAHHNQEFFCDKVLELSRKSDLVILADFGHGLFEGDVLKTFEDISTFTTLNVQANSSNFGFNVYTKHKRFDYLCIDTREARLAEHDRYSSPLSLAELIAPKISPSMLGMTLGPNGSYLSGDGFFATSPAFAHEIIDAVGAGDAYFGITSCLLKTGCKPELIPFIGNVFAGLKTKIVGNKSPVSKASLLKACAGILK